jgi:dihydrodipicolinate synthase/N-acetylneuraminate lyase
MRGIKETVIDPLKLLRPRREIVGMSAVLLPMAADGTVDWPEFRRHLERTQQAGLTPAVNMDTGYVNLLDAAARLAVLDATRETLAGEAFVAAAFVPDAPGDAFALDAYCRTVEIIQSHSGTPIIFQSFGLTGLAAPELIDAYRKIAANCDSFLAFELGTMFAPFGRIYDLATYAELLKLPRCRGAKHSSLSRELEWQRLRLRDQNRPDFMVLTGNDLAIDMVMYGSDYLLGLSTMAPDLFALRDQMWQSGDVNFYELNDLLQFLGCFAFRHPVPGYRHNAAQFLKLRGWIESDATHPASIRRPDSDREVLEDILKRISTWTASAV